MGNHPKVQWVTSIITKHSGLLWTLAQWKVHHVSKMPLIRSGWPMTDPTVASPLQVHIRFISNYACITWVWKFFTYIILWNCLRVYICIRKELDRFLNHIHSETLLICFDPLCELRIPCMVCFQGIWIFSSINYAISLPFMHYERHCCKTSSKYRPAFMQQILLALRVLDGSTFHYHQRAIFQRMDVTYNKSSKMEGQRG